MKLRLVEYDNRESIIIYISEQERNSPETVAYINDCRDKYDNVILFVSGKNQIEKTLLSIVIDAHQ